MSEQTTGRKVSMPKIGGVELRNFDIYTRQPTTSVQIEKQVFCLIGANGLGKSTFLNTVNFIVTGAIPDPSRIFQSADDYYRNASRIDRTNEYFNGRISERLRELASASVELVWPTRTIKVSREIFAPTTSCSFEVSSRDTAGRGSPAADSYEQEIVKLCGLQDY